MEHSIHYSEEQLELYALGRLPETGVEGVEEHLLTCQVCCERLENAATFAGSMREALRESPVPVREPRTSWFAWLLQPRFAMAGGFAAVLLAVGILWSGASRVPAMATLQLAAIRGDMQAVGQAKELNLTLTDAPSDDLPLQLEVVDGSGAKIWGATVPGGNPAVHASIGKRLSPGDYFVRLYGASGRLVHEYGFRVHE